MSPPTTTADPTRKEPLDPQRWVDRHGDYLFRYAVGRVRRQEVAEELVQETLLAAWRGRGGYGGRASERSWLTAILKRKVIDWLRAAVRARERADEPATDKTTDKLFTSGGRWKSGPAEWASDTPDAGVEREEFWAVVAGCVGRLPDRLRDVFVLWHLDEQPTEVVCRAAGVKANHLWVMLHRARLRMWRCLSRGWYGVDPDERSGRRDEP
jgi:RNA polymerase sigma-70 factor (TIGR02943 family)